MSLLLKHWQLVGWAVGVLALVAFVHQRDARIRAEGEATVYLAIADSLHAVADSFEITLARVDEDADRKIEEAQEQLAALEANIEFNEDSTDDTLDQLEEIVEGPAVALVDSLEVQIERERQNHEHEVLNLYAIIQQQSDQLAARDQRIDALQRALEARIELETVREPTGTGWLEKAGYAVGGLAIGYLAGRVE